mgnify:CR=1 FL=1
MDVSIILPLFNPDKEILTLIERRIKEQDFKGKIEVIKVEMGMGLAASMNYGIKKAKYGIVITLHQDSIPVDDKWLKDLTAPFQDDSVVASVSKVCFPDELYERLDIFTKSMMLKEKGTITPLLDEKGCAYRKEVIMGLGLFNDRDFKTSGEDFDMYIRIKDKGKIAYPSTAIIHHHPTSFLRRLKKIYQNSNGFGANVRIHRTNMPRWFLGFFRAIPIIGIIPLLLTFPFGLGGFLYFPFMAISPLINIIYTIGFWKGFLMKKQSI